MRLIATFDKEPLARRFSNFLLNQGIENECEIDLSREGKEPACTIWVYDEDQYEQALSYLKQFNINPEAPSFSATAPSQAPATSNEAPRPQSTPNLKSKNLLKVNKQIGKITTGVIVICVMIFLFQFFTESRSPLQTELKTIVLPQIPALFSPVEKALLYDYPQTFVLLSQLYRLYTVDEIDDPDHAPLGAKLLVAKIQKTPFWPGAYALLIAKMEGKEPMPVVGPLFEKIREGQVWRLITPSFLHGDLLHLFFNMLWFFALGPQIEQRLGAGRTLLFIVMTAIVSNTAQYLMSGPNFLGFSGVVAAMLGFIWIRQKRAAWEGYFLNRSTLLFVFFFIIAMLVLQVFSFAISLSSEYVIPINIGNTSHIVGGLMGIALGATSWFNWRPNTINKK